MEVALLQLYHFRLKAYNFPQVRDLAFQRRVHTGAGRYTYMSHGGEIDLPGIYRTVPPDQSQKQTHLAQALS